MTLSTSKTNIVCTIGPASESPEIIEKMIHAGMNVARLNFSHGDFTGHNKVIETIRRTAETAGQHVAIMADPPVTKESPGKSPDGTHTTERISGRIKAPMEFDVILIRSSSWKPEKLK